VAHTLAGSVRSTDILARFGGDEFALALPGTDRQQAEIVMAKLGEALRKGLDSGQAKVTCSSGCVTFFSPPPSVEVALHAADMLMYKVKREGRDGVAFASYDFGPKAWEACRSMSKSEPFPEPGK